MTLRLRIVDESCHDERSRQSSSTDMDVSRKASLSRRDWLGRLSVILLHSSSKRSMKAIFLHDRVQRTILRFRGDPDIFWNSRHDQMKSYLSRVTFSLSFYPVLNHFENWIEGKNTIQQCIWEQVSSRVKYVTQYASILILVIQLDAYLLTARTCWFIFFYVFLTITFSNTVSSYPRSEFTWLSVLSWSCAFIFSSTLCYFCASLWRKLSVWISVRPRSLLQIMQSVRIFALSSVVLCLFFFFRFFPPCFSVLFVRVRKVRERKKLLPLLKEGHDCHTKEKKKRCSTKPRTLWRSAYLLHETSRPWTYAQAHSSHLLTSARLLERFQRRHPKLAQPVFSRSIANLLHCSVRVSVHTRDLGHFKLLKVRKVTFTILSQILSKNCPWGNNNNTTRVPISAPSSAAKFSLVSKVKTIQKRLSKPFINSLLTNIWTTSASTSSPPFATNSVLTVFFGLSKRSTNVTQICSWEVIDVKSLEICSAVRCKSRLSNS